jgi:hypothetical protein
VFYHYGFAGEVVYAHFANLVDVGRRDDPTVQLEDAIVDCGGRELWVEELTGSKRFVSIYAEYRFRHLASCKISFAFLRWTQCQVAFVLLGMDSI